MWAFLFVPTNPFSFSRVVSYVFIILVAIETGFNLYQFNVQGNVIIYNINIAQKKSVNWFVVLKEVFMFCKWLFPFLLPLFAH
jgi:hypothetical protein